jgi:hypothetical protein
MTWTTLRVSPPLTAAELRELLSHTAAYDDPGVRAINAWRAGRMSAMLAAPCECPKCRRERGAA